MPNNIYKLPNGLQVRVQRNKKEHNKSFLYKNFESESAARKAAEEYRSKLLAKLPEADKKHNYEKTPYYPESMNKSTGVSGVYRTAKMERSGRRNKYYSATVRYSKDNVKSISRSIRKHGEIGAFIQVVNFRQEGLKEVYGDRFNFNKFIKSVEVYLRKIQKEERQKQEQEDE